MPLGAYFIGGIERLSLGQCGNLPLVALYIGVYCCIAYKLATYN